MGRLSTGNLCESEGVRVREGVAAREGGLRGEKHAHKNKEGKKVLHRCLKLRRHYFAYSHILRKRSQGTDPYTANLSFLFSFIFYPKVNIHKKKSSTYMPQQLQADLRVEKISYKFFTRVKMLSLCSLREYHT